MALKSSDLAKENLWPCIEVQSTVFGRSSMTVSSWTCYRPFRSQNYGNGSGQGSGIWKKSFVQLVISTSQIVPNQIGHYIPYIYIYPRSYCPVFKYSPPESCLLPSNLKSKKKRKEGSTSDETWKVQYHNIWTSSSFKNTHYHVFGKVHSQSQLVICRRQYGYNI